MLVNFVEVKLDPMFPGEPLNLDRVRGMRRCGGAQPVVHCGGINGEPASESLDTELPNELIELRSSGQRRTPTRTLRVPKKGGT
jgi:hypothetical protein